MGGWGGLRGGVGGERGGRTIEILDLTVSLFPYL